jgi:hypothetical protein
MSYQTVEAGRGIEWLKGAIQIAMANPGVFVVMALILAVVAVVPIVGQLALLVFGPALFGGFIWAIREHEQGRSTEIGQLFTAFQQPGKLGPMVMLCLPTVAAGLLMVVVAFFAFGAALLGVASGGGDSSGAGAVAAIGGAVLAGVVGLVLGVVLFLLLIFSIPRVMFDGIDPIAAMKESLAAGMANIVAVIVLFVLLLVILLVVTALTFWLPLIGQLVQFTIVYALFCGVIYFAYKDVFGVADAAPPAYVPPPAPPAPPAG